MKTKAIFLASLLSIQFQLIAGQDIISDAKVNTGDKLTLISGFVKGGVYWDLNREKSESFFSSGFSDAAIKIETGKSSSYKAFADIRFRYGTEFRKQVNMLSIREAYVDFTGKRWNLSLGQKILKWGRADFTNPTSKLNPQNLILRSPEREDMDMGNILTALNWYPTEIFSVQAVIVPFYRPSVLLIDPIPLPENTTIDQINGLMADNQMLSYGLRTDLHLKGIDMGVSWFEGYDPMPGIELLSFVPDFSGPTPLATTQLSVKPYKTRVIGFDFESAIGPIGLRGEGAFSIPSLSYEENEFVPLKEINWVGGIDWSPGNWRFIAEYSGKYLPEFQPAGVDPIIGTDPDFSKLAELMAIPGFDINDYVRRQVGAFNRLYNYQLKKSYHSLGIRAEADLLYGKILPSVFAMCNLTTQDLILIPEIRYKPSDGIVITAGMEFFSGKKSSLYDIVNDFMNAVYVGVKVDF